METLITSTPAANNPVYQQLSHRQTRRAWLISEGGTLHFELEVVSIDNVIDNDDFEHNSSYVALSYTWGEHDTIDVAVKGLNGQFFPVSVTKSLLIACERIHSRIMSGTAGRFPMWIDQLCIDQKNHAEKISQIRLMRDIYEASRNVLIWLGLADSESDAAMTMIHDIRTRFHKLSKAEPKFSRADGGIDAEYMPILTGPATEENIRVWKAMLKLLDRPWFSRVWIIQEATARKIFTDTTYALCGDVQIFFDDFLRLFHLIATVHPASWNHEMTNVLVAAGLWEHLSFNMICTFWMNKQMYSYFHLLDLLRYVRGFDAFDLRDKLFAIASFASDTKGKHELKLSYQKSVEQTFIDFAIWYILEYGNLDFLGHLHRDTKTDVPSRVPAWVPDWTEHSAQNHHHNYYETIFMVPRAPLYHACGRDRLDKLTISGDIGVTAALQALTVSGVRLTSITAWFPDVDDCEGFGTTMMLKHCPLNKTPLAHVYSRTMCMDSMLGVRDRRPCTMRGSYYQQDTQCPKGLHDCLHNFPGIPDPIKSPKEFTQTRHWFMLNPIEGDNQGVMGLGGRSPLPGDELWALEGGKLLYILRPWYLQHEACIHKLDVTGDTNQPQGHAHAQGTKMYQFIGEAFVLGLMDGEIPDMLGDTPKQPRPPCLEHMDSEFHKIDILNPKDLLREPVVEDQPLTKDEMDLIQIKLGSAYDVGNLKQFADKKRYWPGEVFGGVEEGRTIFSKSSDRSPPFLTFDMD